MDKKTAMKIANEKGIALVLALFLMMAMSVIGSSLMLLSQTETYSSMNYRLMSQARYGAESGLQKAGNYLLYSYTTPSTGGADSIANYNTNVSPVTCAAGCPIIGQPVVLSGSAAQASNYPVAAVQTAFSAAVVGSVPAAGTTVSYAPYATLLSMQEINLYGGGVATLQTWRLTSDGTITAGRTAQVQVTAILETPKFPTYTYAAFSTAPGCGSMRFTSGTITDSYDSAAYGGVGVPVLTASGGNVGTNGNLNISGSSPSPVVNGTLSTPRVGVGSCSAGNVTASSASGGATVTGGLVQLPQAVIYPTPAAPTPLPPTTPNDLTAITATCASAGLPSCTGPAGNLTINPALSATPGTVSLGNVSLGNSVNLHLKAGTYNMNSYAESGGILTIDSGPVIINLTGTGVTYPLNWSGGDVINATFKAANLQILYGGTKPLFLHAGAESGATRGAMMILAPNAPINFTQGGAFYGSIVGSTIDDAGVSGVQIHYDRALNASFFKPGNPMMSSFSWKKY
jgi:Tfp pilus assembly protein PilX